MSGPVILCVDDEEIVLESLKEQLKREFGSAFIYEMAASADDAWEIIEELEAEGTQIGVVISDHLMPRQNGDAFLIQLHQRNPKIAKIMLTGQADERIMARTRKEANLYHCLYKPWSETELIETIRSALEGSQGATP